MKVLGYVLGGLVAALMLVLLSPLAIYHAWVVTKLWGWFAVPLGVRQLGVAHAYGIMLVLGSLRGRYGRKHEFEKGAAFWGSMLLGPLVTLGIGYVAHYFMVSP